ncbi:MAG: hypothetical protein JGK38_24210 [Microcoleus sp. PH2017_15_JOR_U_A]|jgi:hypothetical protein|uniref:DUF6876 family protein n=1 Tax=Microcoleus sp. PH2017_15_JOR_U_A TaxID=2798826 RepID=UPI001DA2BEA4|nr:DUF6876 family protein [Microcoleus sp. PH2017_15_JOR_U_A]MCC3499661.1 hypothetical protein [Microcoleus sp. PH2017_15_JOR_U_A]MCC3513926.1 hypothetical protein [Microcoleus sp. PH2017_17_BER_D_A]TAE35301.1 MAG: hypothetical protein EAZ90_30685 [Oscillatoriales cyanobacterium]TAE58168.1 MAG: hypothetical protein EAZ88_00060 [Oscillatoriales cyanobacterium]
MTLTKADLAQFTGTSRYYQHWLGLRYTDCVQFLADRAGACWLLDAIASHQPNCLKDPMLQEIQFWKLKVENQSGVLVCERDQGDVYLSQQIPFTDFPLDSISLYLADGILYLPSEH